MATSAGTVDFPSKRSGETVTLPFDFTAFLAVGETISSAFVTIRVYSGAADPVVDSMISGSASISGKIVSQKVTAGVAGNIYVLICHATISGSQIIQLGGILALSGYDVTA